MSDIWGYPYRLGIGIFLVVSTFLMTVLFVGFTLWLEKYFKKTREQK
jgi:hypothetical protein